MVFALKGTKEILPAINDRIRADRLQLITHEGTNVGIVTKREALHLAEVAELDLVQISESGKLGVPVAKIMDFGKAVYEKKKKQHETKKHQKIIQVKEIKLRPKIGDHDYETKMKQAMQFLESGKRVKITLFFRGRERLTKNERGAELFKQVANTFQKHELDKLIAFEGESMAGNVWSRIYFLKNSK